MHLDILAFGAHPDDVELGCSGTLIKHIKKGAKVGIIDLTQGELGTRGNIETRKQEALVAQKIIGAEVRENLKLKDGFINDDDQQALLAIIEKIRSYTPKIVLCNASSDRHPDHGIASTLVERACFLSGLSKIKVNNTTKHRPQLVLKYVQDRYIKPDIVIDISDEFDTKMKAIMAFSSQFYTEQNKHLEQTPISSALFLEHVKGRAIDFGRNIQTNFAEGFNCSRTIGVHSLFELQ